MRTRRDLAWRYWTATLVPLGLGVAGWPPGIPLALCLCVIQVLHFAWRDRSSVAFSVQIRLAFLGLLLLGLWLPTALIHWVQFAGTTVRVIYGSCLLAWIVSLAPWNRQAPLSWRLSMPHSAHAA